MRTAAGSESKENTETTNVESAVSDEIGETTDVSASAVNLPGCKFFRGHF